MQKLPDCIRSIYMDKSITDPLLSTKLILDQLDSNPDDKDYIYAWAIIALSNTGNNELVIEYCKKFLPLIQTQECIQSIKSSLIYGYEKLELFDDAMVIRLENMGTSVHPENDMEEIAQIYEKREDWDNAIKYYEMYITQTNENCENETYSQLADIYDKVKDYKNSAKYYEKAAKQICDDSVWLWQNTGRALAIDGKEEEAKFYFQIALKINPQNEMAHYFMGQIYQNTNDVYRAMHHYTEALKIDPYMAIVYNNMAGISLDEDGDIKKAIELLEKAVEVSEDKQFNAQLYLSLSKLNNKICDYDKHEYYKAKWGESLGFPPGFIGSGLETEEEDDDDE